MDQWVNKLMRCDKSPLELGCRVSSLQAQNHKQLLSVIKMRFQNLAKSCKILIYKKNKVKKLKIS